MKEMLAQLAEGRELSSAQAEAATAAIMTGQATPAQTGAFLAALRCRGETVAEILGCARAMRRYATPVVSRHPILADTCGTGGDGSGTFNISTAAAFVAAGAGLAVAKHGNRAASSRAGSADVLEALGVRIDLGPEDAGRCLDEVGIAFLFAQRYHEAMRHAAGPRRELGFRTVFNLLGPLCNPAGAQVQVVGVAQAQLVLPMADVLRQLGARRALVVHGCDGLDEFSTTGPSVWADTAAPGEPRLQELTPEAVGLERANLDALRGGSANENAAIVRAVLGGEPGPRREIVLLNAAAVLYAAGLAPDWPSALSLAAEAVDSGRAARRLEALRAWGSAAGAAG